jgi:hypothetical protein
MSYNKFDEFLIKMSNNLATKDIAFTENSIHIYYDNYLYANIKNIATFDKPVNIYKWSYSHEFIVSGVGIRGKYYFDLKHPGEILFDTVYDDYPFYNNQHLIIEKILRQDDGQRKKIEIVREIATAAHVLLMPYFVEISRLKFT